MTELVNRYDEFENNDLREVEGYVQDCETCEGVGLVAWTGPAGVPHTVPCPKCSPTEGGRNGDD